MADEPVATWRDDRGIDVTMTEPRRRGQCNRSCPWRFENHGQLAKYEYDHEIDGAEITQTVVHYTADRAWHWWQHLKTGEYGDTRSLCHVVSKGSDFDGPEPRWIARQCTGGLVIQQRELLRHVEHGRSKLTPKGAARVATAMLGREITRADVPALGLRELLEHAHASLLDPEIGSLVHEPLSVREIKEWARG